MIWPGKAGKKREALLVLKQKKALEVALKSAEDQVNYRALPTTATFSRGVSGVIF